MVLQGKSILDVTKTLNAEGIPTTNGKKWLKTTIHTMLANEALEEESMNKVEAFIRPEKLDNVKDALANEGILGLSVI